MRILVNCLAVSVLVSAMMLVGCNGLGSDGRDADRVAALQGTIDTINQSVADLKAVNEKTQAELDALQAAGGDQDEIDRVRAFLDERMEELAELEGWRDQAQEAVTAVGGTIDEDGNISLPDAVQELTPMAAAFAGPYAPLVILGSNLLTGVLTRMKQRNNFREVTNAIDAARDGDLVNMKVLKQTMSANGRRVVNSLQR